MKNILLALGLMLGVVSVNFAQGFVNVNAAKFNELLKKGDGIVLDVRTPQEYSRGHIANSTLINIADRDFSDRIALLQKDKPIYVYCLSGSRSRSAAGYLVRNGFTQVYNLQQGLMDWQRNQLPLEQSAVKAASDSKVYSQTDFQALVQSKNLVFVDFNAPWCAPCRTMSPVVDQLSEQFKQQVKVEKIDVEANRELAKALDIQSIPGFILYKNGKKIWSGKGVLSYDELSGLLKKNL